MDLQTKYTIANTLDKVLADVGEAEFRRLTADIPHDERDLRVRRAAASVNEVQQLQMPSYYDELVALFYAGRFHLSHVNLAYSMIDRMVTRRDPLNFTLTTSGRLYVVDFGCGTLVMRFGTIFAVADALERGQDITEIRIDSIDPNTPMVNMGVKIWDEFLNRIQEEQNPRLRWIRMAVDKMANQRLVVRNITLDVMQGNPDADVWLSAIHIVYGGPGGNEVTVRDDLARLCAGINPMVGFITCHNRNAEIARRISPFGNDYRGQIENPIYQFTNHIPTPNITDRCRNWRFFPQNWRVFWRWDKNPTTTTCLIYHRQRQ